jgi:thiopeptide-type bacteriocin biosynthesis protein
VNDPQWLYQKLFVDPTHGEIAGDQVLVHHVGPISDFLIEQGWIDRFFFLRYGEGGFHIRYRVRLARVADAAAVAARLQRAAEEADGIVRVEPADYEPETDKYGGRHGMDICEQAFYASSRFALSCIARTLERPSLRLIVAVFAFDALLSAADIQAFSREALLIDYANYWNTLFRQRGSVLYPPEPSQKLAVTLAEQLSASNGRLEAVADLVGPGLDTWLSDLQNHIAEINTLSQDGRLTTSRSHILCNLAHTMNNRLGMSPLDEVFIADLLRHSEALRETTME